MDTNSQKKRTSKLLTRDQVFENFGNPILDPSIFAAGSKNFEPCSDIQELNLDLVKNPFNCSGDIIDNPPAWSDPDVIWKPGERLLFGATLINGIPITSWGGMMAGTVQMQMKNVMMNAQWLDDVVRTVFPNGMGTLSREISKISLDRLSILKMTPMSSGIGLAISIEFNLNDDINLMARFASWPDNFVCEPLNNLSKEDYIKIVGQIRNKIVEFFKPKAGVYVCSSQEILVWTEMGQVGRLHEGDQIEVIQSTDEKIFFTWKDVKWMLKKPTYWWFNWNFVKK